MRFIFIIISMLGIGLIGWIAGSLYPAPASILSPINQLIAGDQQNPDLDDGVAPPSDAVESSNAVPSLEQYRTWIREARAKHPYPESEDKMYAVMMCESGGQADIVNPAGPYSGLFQYVDGTWKGDWNLYRDRDIFDAEAQILATALAWNQNMQSHWGCYSRSH